MQSYTPRHSAKRYAGQNRALVPAGGNLTLVQDKDIQGSIHRLKAAKDSIEEINDAVRRTLGLPLNRRGRFLAGLFRPFQRVLPEGLARWVEEEFDPLEFLEKHIRQNVDGVQEALRDLAATAIAEKEDLDALSQDIQTAKEQSWDAQTLQKYLAESAGIEIYSEIAQLLDNEFKLLSDEERERRKEELLDLLENNVGLGQELMRTMERVCVSGIQVFHTGVSQYYSYLNVVRPIAVIRDSAKALTEMDASMMVARGALEVTLKRSVEAIDAALTGAQMIDRYAIASPDMEGLLKSAQGDLNKKLAALQAPKEKTLALEAGERGS